MAQLAERFLKDYVPHHCKPRTEVEYRDLSPGSISWTPAEAYRGEGPVDMMDKPLRALPTSPQAQQQQREDRFRRILAA